MPQFRLTQKFAKDINITTLATPKEMTSVYDDWFIDVITVQRQRVALLMHSKTLLTFCVPYPEVGGASNVPDCICVFITEFLAKHDLEQLIDEAQEALTLPIIYCKTNNQSVLAHLNNAKEILENKVSRMNAEFYSIHWEQLSEELNTIPIKALGFSSKIEYAISEFSSIHIESTEQEKMC